MASTVSAVSFATSPICMLLVARSETCGMLKGYTLECGPESRAFSEMSVVTVMAQWRSMSSVPQIPKQDTFRRIRQIQTVTIVWMTVEAAVSQAAAWMARSPALLAFGGDSAIELFSAIVVLWRFRAHADQEQSEKIAARIAGALLFVLAAYVVVSSGLSLLGYREPQPSFAGIILLIVAAIGMPWLASQKRKLATQVVSAS